MGCMDTATPRRGRPPKGESRLTREAIVEATLDVIADSGVGGVTMRAVGRELGVDAKSLYNHVDGKGGLLDSVAEHVLATIALPALTGDTEVDLRAIAAAFRAPALRHPEAAALVLTRRLASFEGLTPVELVLSVLRDAGCPPDESVHLLRVFVATLIGSLLREVRAGPTFGTTDTEKLERRRTELEGSGFTAIVGAAQYLARFDGPTEYEFAVEFAIEGLMARLARRS